VSSDPYQLHVRYCPTCYRALFLGPLMNVLSGRGSKEYRGRGLCAEGKRLRKQQIAAQRARGLEVP